MTKLYSNNATAVLTAAALSTDTIIYCDTSLFPAFTAGDEMWLTLASASELDYEIVKCTAATSTSYTVERGIGNTSPLDWPINTRVELRITSELVHSLFADLNPDTIQFTGGTGTEGTLSWSADDLTLSLDVGNGVSYQLGQELGQTVRNLTGTTVTNGQIVQITGASGDKPIIGLADNTNEAASSATFAVATETFSNNSTGRVTTNGLVRGLDTSALTEGLAIWLGTSGQFTTTKPNSPAHLVHLGWVVRSHATEGMILVHISNGWEVEELHDVLITNISDGDMLVWDAANSLWVNQSLAEIGISAVGHTHVISDITDFTDNSTNWNTAYGWGDHATAGYVTNTSAQALHATDAISIVGNILYLNKADGTNETVDLSLYLDDTNLARIVSGTYDAGTQSLVFTRDDETTFSIDASMFFDDTNLVTSVAGRTGAITLTESDITDFGFYEPADATILKDADIGVTVQGYDANIVSDGSYVHTDNNYTTTEKNKLAGIEDGADVTDTANVTAAGALMDSEVTNLAAVKAFDPTDYATAAQGTLADSALQSSDIGVSVQAYNANTVIDSAYVHTDNNYTTTEKTKLLGIEANADVTDSTNVAAAGAVMESDTTTAAMSFVIDEDDMVSNLNTKVPTQQSVKAYVDGRVASSVNYAGSYNASTNSPDLDTSPSGVSKGDMYTVTVAGTFFTISVEVGDVLIAEVDSASTEADWTIVNKNLDASSIKTSYESNSDTNAYTDAEKSKLAGIEAGADVTDTTNVTAAGALMDSELTNITAVKALDQGVATTNSPRFNALRIGNGGIADLSIKYNQSLSASVGGSTTASIISNYGTSVASNHIGFEIPANDPDDGFFVTTDSNQDGTPDTVALKIRANGNVGVKNTSPSEALDVSGNIAVSGTVDGRDIATDGSKLDGIEAGATADQTAAEIKTAYESNANTNAYTDAEQTKLSGIESGATADQTASEILTAIKTVDGSGSGLDADKLDGQHGSYYTSYTDTAIANLVAAAPATLDTLNELAAALGDDPNFATTVTNNIATKVSKSGDTMTGDLTFGDNNKAVFGAGSNLKIFYNGTNSVIGDTGNGNLSLQTNGSEINLWDTTNNRRMATFSTDGVASLNYAGTVKLSTASTGVEVNGIIDTDSGLRFGGTNSYLYEATSDRPTLRIGADGPYLTLGKDLGNGKIGFGNSSNTLSLPSDGSIVVPGGIEAGSIQGYKDFSALVDFGSNVAGTWRKLVDVVSPNQAYSTIGFTVHIHDNNSNTASSGSIDNSIFETYVINCSRTNGTVIDDPDACYVRGPRNLIRAVKTAVGTYEIQIQNLALYREYRVDIKVHAVNGNHTVSYSNGGTASAGIEQYNATTTEDGNTLYLENGNIAGLLALGATNPATKLHVADTGTPAIRIEDLDASSGYVDYAMLGNTAITTVTGDGGNPAYFLQLGANAAQRWLNDGTIQFFNLGSEVMRVTNTGNVGIGTTAPGDMLTVVAGADSPNIVTAFGADTSEYAAMGASGTSAYFTAGNTGSGSTDLRLRAANAGSELDRVIIKGSTGNVGIGTTAPSEKLHVVGNSKVTGDAYVDGTVIASRVDAANTIVGNGGGTYDPAGGGTGVDTTTVAAFAFPSGKSIVGTNDGYIRNMLKWTSGSAIEIGQSGTSLINGVKLLPGNSGYVDIVASGVDQELLRFSTERTWSFYQRSSGSDTELDLRPSVDGKKFTVTTTSGANVATFHSNSAAPRFGVGTGSPQQTFHVYSTTGEAAHIQRTSDGTAIKFSSASGTAGYISVSGTTTSYNTSSDYRLKEAIEDVTGATDRVKLLNPVNFAWKDNGKRVDGFLAHELSMVVPEAVTGEKDAVDDEGNPIYQGIDQSKLVPILTAALQEALTRIEALEAKL